MIVGAWVQAFSAAGMIEASATRSPFMPNDTQPRIDDGGRIAAHAACPARMEEGRGAGANVLLDRGLIIVNRAGRQLCFDQIANRPARASCRACGAPSARARRRSSGSEKYSGKIRGCAVGSVLRSRIWPRLRGRPEPTITVKP